LTGIVIRFTLESTALKERFFARPARLQRLLDAGDPPESIALVMNFQAFPATRCGARPEGRPSGTRAFLCDAVPMFKRPVHSL
jgi:hypothetical protein